MAEKPDKADFQAEIDSLKKDLHSVRGDLEKMANSAMKRGHKEWDQSVESVNQTIEDHPMGTLAGAFGVGLIAGLILSRKH